VARVKTNRYVLKKRKRTTKRNGGRGGKGRSFLPNRPTPGKKLPGIDIPTERRVDGPLDYRELDNLSKSTGKRGKNLVFESLGLA